jgi:hypothetical protein
MQFSLLFHTFFIAQDVQTGTQVKLYTQLYVYLFILHSVHPLSVKF